MWSLGEVVVLTVAAAWVFGPKELPRIARTAGRLTGQATGFLYRTRARFFKFAEETEMTKLHEEVQATMHQLHAIRSELQGGISLFNPGPLAQRAMSLQPLPDRGEHGASAPTAAASQQPPPQQQQQPAAGSWAASALPATPAAASAQQAWQQQPQPRQGAGEEGDDAWLHPLTVPVSAVAAGWAPQRTGAAPSGSEILLDALAEEAVAAQVLRLQQQQLAAAARAAAADAARGGRTATATAAARCGARTRG